ncbi:uncharacterized protein BDV17DRAFT_288048 [Aspergillus undulatus]|uniref:uncharacterized protein n=1 Tax=Aspergillus undulatus TaxID=1810928 RepID=UPI003CCD9FF9
MVGTLAQSKHILSPVDHKLAQVYINLCLYFRSTRPGESVPTLQLGVDELVKLLPWICGKVVQCEDKHSAKHRGLQCIQQSTTPGAIPMIQFATDRSLSLEGIAGARPRTGVEELRLMSKLPPLPPFLGPSDPIYVVRFKATVVSDGVILAMSFCHTVFDVTGAAHILQHLAECCQSSKPKQCVCLDDKALRQDMWTMGFAGVSAGYSNNDKLTPLFSRGTESLEGDMEVLARKNMLCRWKIPGHKVSRLKRACNALLATRLSDGSDSPIKFLSSFDVLTGILTRVLHPDPGVKEGVSDIGIAVNLRDRMTPSWPSSYMGNLVRCVPIMHPSPPLEDSLVTAAHLVAADNGLDIPAVDLGSVYRNACCVRQALSMISVKWKTLSPQQLSPVGDTSTSTTLTLDHS